MASREVPLEQANLMRLLNLLRDPDTTDSALEEVFRADVRLTYRLLRIVNSASMGHTGVTSIGHGIRLLGRATLPFAHLNAIGELDGRRHCCSQCVAHCLRRRLVVGDTCDQQRSILQFGAAAFQVPVNQGC